MIEQDKEVNEFSNFEDPDFGPPLSEAGEIIRKKILDLHEDHNLPATFDFINKKRDERLNKIAKDKYGENCIYIDDNKDKPFLLYMSHFSVHDPIHGRPDLVEKYKKKLVN